MCRHKDMKRNSPENMSALVLACVGYSVSVPLCSGVSGSRHCFRSALVLSLRQSTATRRCFILACPGQPSTLVLACEVYSVMKLLCFGEQRSLGPSFWRIEVPALALQHCKGSHLAFVL